MISNKNRAKVQKYSDINSRLLFFCLLLFGRAGVAMEASAGVMIVGKCHGASLRLVSLLSAAAPSGFPLQYFWPAIFVGANNYSPLLRCTTMIYNSFLAKNISAAIPLAIPAGTDVCNTSLHPPPDHNPVIACRPCRGLDERGKRLIYRALPPIGVCGKRGTLPPTEL